MTRHRISFTPPNDEWLKAQVESGEYTNKSDVVNDLIHKAREIEYNRTKLIRAEQGDFTHLTTTDILAKSKEALRNKGDL